MGLEVNDLKKIFSATFGLGAADRFLDAAVLLFAGWTLLVHRIVAQQGTLSSLLHWSIPTLLGMVGVFLWIRKTDLTNVEFGRPLGSNRDFRETILLSAIVFGIVGFWILIWFPDLVWSYGVGGLGLYTVVGIRQENNSSGKPSPAGVLFLAVLVVAVGLTMTVKRPDRDDSYYIAMGISVKQAGEKPLLCCDFVHLRDDLPIRKPSDQLRSFEVLQGVAAFLTNSPTIVWAHIIFPCLGAILAVLATARLLRSLLPYRWSWALLAWLVILMSVGNAHGWYGNMAFVRMHQGKSLLVTALLPVLWVYALEFSRRRDLPSWILLFAANIAAIGLNPSGLWLAPLATLAGLLAGFDWRHQGIHTLVGGLLAPCYNGLKGFELRSDMDFFLEKSVGQRTSEDLLESASSLVMGQGFLLIGIVACLVLAYFTLATSAPKRFLLATLVVFLGVCNPQWVHLVARFVTGGWTFWRVFWLVPIPLLMAIGAVSLGGTLLGRWPTLRKGRVQVGIVLALWAFVPSVRLLSAQNRVHWGWGLKVPTVEFELAKYVAATTSPESYVLAPQSISAWVATFEHRPKLLAVRLNYLRPDLSLPQDLRIRRWLVREVNRSKPKEPGTRRVFFQFLENYDIETLAFRSVRKSPGIGRRAYWKAGFELKVIRHPYEVWRKRKQAVMIAPAEELTEVQKLSYSPEQ